MAEPSKKSEGVEQFLDFVIGKSRRGQIRKDLCTWCGGLATEFKDEISRQEYRISGCCQKCQDAIFAEEQEWVCPHCGTDCAGECEASTYSHFDY